MKVVKTHLAGCVMIEPQVFGDERGFFLETFQARRYEDLAGIDLPFVQDNHSRSRRGVLRGLHFQVNKPQGKLVRVASGAVFDVAVDLRDESPTFGGWFGAVLSDENKRQLWVPPGFAHGFVVMSETADFEYKCTDYYDSSDEGAIRWNDAEIGIEWPDVGSVQLSKKDSLAPSFAEYCRR